METLLLNNKTYSYHEYSLEKDFEKVIVENASHVFGEKTIYIDIKKRIGDSILTIPDGYLIDFTFPEDPRLYIIENEISSHDPYKHIGSQLLKFAISYKASGRKIKSFLLEHLIENPSSLKKAESGLLEAGYRNIDAFLENIIFEKPVAAIVVIDKATDELENVLSQLSMQTAIIEFQSFLFGSELIHKLTPFNAEINEVVDRTTRVTSFSLSPKDLDTVIVPAKEEGFERVFIGENRWHEIRIGPAMLERIKYIAAYQVAPVSAITHIAEVASIERWKDTNKYVLNFKEPAKEIGPIELDGKGLAPQAPRYTSYERLIKATKLSQIF